MGRLPLQEAIHGPAIAFWATLTILVITLPLAHTTAVRSICIAALLGITFWQTVRKKIEISVPLFFPWLIYIAISLISLVHAIDFDYSLKEFRAEILIPFILFVISASWITKKIDFERLILLITSGNILFIAGSAWNYWQQGSLGTGVAAWDAGVGNTSTTIVMTLPLILTMTIKVALDANKRRLLTLLLIIANLWALLVTLNRQGWIALLAAVIVMLLLGHRFLNRKALTGVIASLILISAFGLMGFQLRAVVIDSNNHVSPSTAMNAVENAARSITTEIVEKDVRWQLWQFSVEAILQNPWAGQGLGREAFQRAYPDYYNARKDEGLPFWHTHNMILNKGIQMGIPGIASFLLLWAALILAVVKELRNPNPNIWAIAMAGVLASTFMKNMTDDFFYRHHAYLFWLVSGAFLGMLHTRNQMRP